MIDSLARSPLPKQHDKVSLLVTLITGTVLTLLAGIGLQQAEALRTRDRQTAATQIVANTLQTELARTEEALRNAGLMIEANPQLTREQFNRHMQKVVENQLSVNLIEWQPIVRADELAKFEAAVRRTWLPDFRVVQPDASGQGWEPVHGRSEYVPVLYFWPEQYRTGGLDMSFSPERMASKLQSQSLRRPVASGVFDFIKEGKTKSGTLAMAISTTVFGADGTAEGYLAAVVDLSTLFQSATRLADRAKFDLLVFASATPTADPIYTSLGADSDLKQVSTGLGMATTGDPSATVEAAHQSWRLVLHPRPAFYAEVREYGSLLAFVAGTGMTLLMILYLYQLQISRRTVEHAESLERSARQEHELLSNQLQEAQRIAHLGSWRSDLVSNKLVWSDELFHIFEIDQTRSGATYEAFLAAIHPEDRDAVNTAYRQSLETRQPCSITHRLLMPDGRIKYVHQQCDSFFDADGKPLRSVGTVQDITERKLIEDQVRQLAFYDPLTQLPNRRLLFDRLQQALAASKRSGCHGAVMFLDLDNFKPLNDLHGHAMGDLFLIETASRLRGCVREMDTVGRFGGDEFVVIVSELGADHAASREEAMTIAEKIRGELAKPYLLTLDKDQESTTAIEHHSTASIGVTLFVGSNAIQEEILKRVDTAMYQAKVAGRNQIRFHDSGE